jgi:hypothetical protein
MLRLARTAIVALIVGLGVLPARALGAPTRDAGATACRKVPAGKRTVRVNLKPNTNVTDLTIWISSVTCRQFILPGTIASMPMTVTIVAPRLLTPEEAYDVFLDALDSIHLTVFQDGPFFRVIENTRAHQLPIPTVVPGDNPGNNPGNNEATPPSAAETPSSGADAGQPE